MHKKTLTNRKQQALLTQNNIFHVFLNLMREKKFENITIDNFQISDLEVNNEDIASISIK